METGGRRRHRATDRGVDRLVAFAVGRLIRPSDVRGQRHVPERVDRRIDRRAVFDPEPDRTASMEPAREHLAAQPEPVPLEHEGGANTQLLPRMHQGVPLLPIESCQEQTLDRAATRHAVTEQPRREHAGCR